MLGVLQTAADEINDALIKAVPGRGPIVLPLSPVILDQPLALVL